MAKNVWIVTTDGQRDIHAIGKDLARAGFTVTQTFSELPCVAGTAVKAVIAKVRKVKGVVDVSPETTVSAAPSGTKLTW